MTLMGVEISYKERLIHSSQFLFIFLYLIISENLPINCDPLT